METPHQTYLYNPGIMGIMPVAGGCLTRKRTSWCLAVLHDVVAVFVDFSYFLLLFLLGVSFVSYFLLGLGVRFVTFCYFFTSCNFEQLLFTGPGGPGWRVVFIVRGGNLGGCRLIFLFYFYCWRGGGWKLMFFFPPDIWKGGRRRGERGTFRIFWECFFHCGEGREGFTRGNFLYKFIMGRGKACTGGLGCTLIFFLLFFPVEGEGGGG
jgi:hypothetical protein